MWRGSRIDHPSGEHDDWANAAIGAVVCAEQVAMVGALDPAIMRLNATAPSATRRHMPSSTAEVAAGISGARRSVLALAFDVGRKAFGG